MHCRFGARLLVRIQLPGRAALRDVRQADVAQLVAHHLAKVRVAGSNPVVRSKRSRPPPGGPPRWDGREARQRPAKPCTRVRIPFPPRKKAVSSDPLEWCGAISSAGERFPDTEEVTGSIPVSPTSITAGQGPFRALAAGFVSRMSPVTPPAV